MKPQDCGMSILTIKHGKGLRTMTIKDFIDLKIFDENEQIAMLSGDVNSPRQYWTGRLCNIPERLYSTEIDFISSMGERLRTQLNLNRYGWTEIWIVEKE